MLFPLPFTDTLLRNLGYRGDTLLEPVLEVNSGPEESFRGVAGDGHIGPLLVLKV